MAEKKFRIQSSGKIVFCSAFNNGLESLSWNSFLRDSISAIGSF